ncbi:MAG: DUF502 domain-containing protein [Halioglobus sp.]
MKQLFRTTLLGGALFLIPLVLGVMLLGKAFSIMRVVADSVDEFLPWDTIASVPVIDAVATLILVLSCLGAGMIARSDWGRAIQARIDTVLLQLFPGYAWIKGVTGAISDDDAATVFKPVLVELDDQHQLGFEVERSEDGFVVVYLPGAPDPRAGTLSFLPPERVQPLEGDFNSVAKTFKKLGIGAAEIMGQVGACK